MSKAILALQTVRDVTIHLLKTGRLLNEDDISEKRLNLCKICKKFEPKYQRCSVCGCFMTLKTNLEAANCPLGIWDAKITEEIMMGSFYRNHIEDSFYTGKCCGGH